jgi:hypothetical protein
MTNENWEEPTDHNAKGIVGKAYLDIDRVLNVSDYKKEARSTSKNQEKE